MQCHINTTPLALQILAICYLIGEGGKELPYHVRLCLRLNYR